MSKRAEMNDRSKREGEEELGSKENRTKKDSGGCTYVLLMYSYTFRWYNLISSSTTIGRSDYLDRNIN